MVSIKCGHCDFIGITEDQCFTSDGKAYAPPAFCIFKHKGHNPFSGYLHYQCPECQAGTLIDPVDVLFNDFVTDVRSKSKSYGFFQRLIAEG